ncbi:hypothetical protein BG015_009674 [Linnemannia schmuckeri]|uniref:Uncharacterized protein n=1 Tax=Linnemannia schmuckeri TaxID=64567 RepID=A0A9P5RYP5_9FUNG|nr:hypothetical protein BG015_009674 [Linnemannia schmuckeri]
MSRQAGSLCRSQPYSMKSSTIVAILSAISALSIHFCVAASRLTDGIYTIRSSQGSYLVDNKATPGDMVEFSRSTAVSSSPAAQWTVAQNKAASNPNLFSIQNRQSNLYLSLDHSMDTRRNPYTNDEPVKMQKERHDWYLDTTAVAGYYDIESPVMGHQEKAYAIKTPDEGDAAQREDRGLTLKAVGELPSTHQGWLFEAVE